MDWGLFNDEGCVEAGFCSEAEAIVTREANYSPDDELVAALVCSEHPDQTWQGCEECNAED